MITIAAVAKEHGNGDLGRVIWTLRSCGDVAGADVHCFESEKDLLESFQMFLNVCDPDLVTGYNTVNFDLPYLLDRARAMQANFGELGRLLQMQSQVKSSRCRPKNRASKEITMEGRLNFDITDLCRKLLERSEFVSDFVDVLATGIVG